MEITLKNLHPGNFYYDTHKDSVLKIIAIGKKEKRILFQEITLGDEKSEMWQMNEVFKDFKMRKLKQVEFSNVKDEETKELD